MCVFCKIVDREIPTSFLYESERVVAFSDLSPQAPLHILIIPREHCENAGELAKTSPETLAELFVVATSLSAERRLDGYRLVFNTGESAGQSVFHAHLHLLGGRAFAWPPG
jgi:histidine triad (HIT) family protein